MKLRINPAQPNGRLATMTNNNILEVNKIIKRMTIAPYQVL